jgi:uncharacterized radical SAM protein YgiQ
VETAVNDKARAKGGLSAPDLFGYRPYWAKRFGIAPVLPRTRAEMDALGWDSCDVIVVTGDAYVDHPAFGSALVGRLLEAHGFRVGILDQPDWRTTEPFAALGAPNLMFGITAGNMDSLVNHFTSDKKPRSDDAYTPGGEAGKRPDRACIVYAQRCREAFPNAPIVIGGIEASLRRIAHYDYWSDKVRRSVLLDSGADLLVYGNGERQIVEIAHRLGRREPIDSITDVRGTALRVRALPEGFLSIDSRSVDTPGAIEPHRDPYAMEEKTSEPCATDAPAAAAAPNEGAVAPLIALRPKPSRHPRHRTVVRMPSFEDVRRDPILYAHASRILHTESNPHNARALVQRHGTIDVLIQPPPIPLTSAEMDRIYELPYARVPHPAHADRKIPAYEMIRFSITINRGCFGGCSFCSITEHEGRIIQSRSEESVLREVERVRDTVPGFTGVISDLGGPTANMYRLACKSRVIEAACRRPSCVYPDVCENLGTDHGPLIKLYRKARALPGVKKVLIASGVRYDLAIKSPEYVKELASHHVGGYLKIAPEHTRPGPLSLMMKPGIGAYERFKELFDKFSAQAGKEQYLIPYFIAAHPGTTDEDMLALALWLKSHGFRADQVQAFLPSPMASATAMYHTGKNPLRRLTRDASNVAIPKSPTQRKLHKAFLRYHDPNNWPMLREALVRMGRRELIGYSKQQLVPPRQPANWQPDERSNPMRGAAKRPARAARGNFRTQHTGLPPSTDTRAARNKPSTSKPSTKKRAR